METYVYAQFHNERWPPKLHVWLSCVSISVTDLFPNIFYLAADITDQGALDLAVLFDHGLLRDAASKIK